MWSTPNCADSVPPDDMSDAAPNVLDIRDLCVEYSTQRGALRALRNINIVVPGNKIVGIVGESGCGKSTLVAAIIRLMASEARVTEGRILFKGEDLLERAESEMRKILGLEISMIFQDPMQTHNPVLTIGKQMTDIQYRQAASSREKRRLAADMLARVGIPDAKARLDQYPHEFSGGMRQRIAIAMALMAKPSLLIADEPTTALDATLEVQIIQRLRELQSQIGCSILFISHHLGVIAELCDEVVVMYAGEVVEHGGVRDVFHRPAHPYTRKLLECDPGRIKKRTRQLPTIPGEIPDLVELPEGCIFEPRCPHAEALCKTHWPPPTALSASHRASCHLLGKKDDGIAAGT